MTTAAPWLDRLAVPDADRAALLAAAPPPARVEAVAATLRPTIGVRGPDPQLPAVPDEPFFFAHVCLALLPDVRAYHRAHGVADEVSWATLAALGSNIARHRRIYGRPGLDGPRWAVRVFRGLVFRVGRLVFERSHVGAELAGPLGRPADGDALGVHIPPAGPLRPVDCDRAFARAADFFPHHFPDEDLGPAHCRSWLLDPQLAEYLPARSNIVRFGQRFQRLPARGDADSEMVRWTFEAAEPADLTALRPTSTLQRGVLAHLRAGRHWTVPLGWLMLR